MDESEYDDSNRAFLQAFLARGSLTFKDAKPVLAAIFSVHEGKEVGLEDVTIEDLNSYIAAANTAISPLDFEIRSTLDQRSRQRIYALVNTTSDALTQLATTYSADEMAFVKRVLDAMFEGQNTKRCEAMCIKSLDAINQCAKTGDSQRRESTQVGNTNVGLTLKEAERVLTRVVEEGWFKKSGKGFLSLSPRALMELKGWLVETYNEEADDEGNVVERIKFCYACKEIVTVGQRCSRRECPCRVHDICIQSFFRMRRSQSCPICKTEWTGHDFVGEKAITTSKRYLQGKRRSGANGNQASNPPTQSRQRQVTEETDSGDGQGMIPDSLGQNISGMK